MWLRIVNNVEHHKIGERMQQKSIIDHNKHEKEQRNPYVIIRPDKEITQQQ